MSMIAHIEKQIDLINQSKPCSWKITIPNWHPATLNQWDGRHWSVRQKLKASDRQLIIFYGKHVPKATTKRSVKIILHLGYRQRGCDPDAPYKSTCDCLVHAGLLVNDSKEWVELLPVEFLSNVLGKQGRRSTEIILTEID